LRAPARAEIKVMRGKPWQLPILGLSLLLSGCAALVVNSATDTLSAAILDQTDPQLVAEGAPAYLLLLDGMIQTSPDSAELLGTGAQLFAVYGALFSADSQRAVQYASKARDYGDRAICLDHRPACTWQALDFDSFLTALEDVGPRQIDSLFAYGVGWLAYLQATSADWKAVADLPKVQAVLDRLVALDDGYRDGAVHVYLGQLNSLRPPALGGRPDVAEGHFERAIELSGGRDLGAKVQYAKSYARLVYDRELHDRLLTEVLEAPAQEPGLTLFNVLAQQEAKVLLEAADEYF
jgi:hypothetical protein